MSGIVGIYNSDKRVIVRGDIDRMLETISHRGPDGTNIWTSDSVGLGHCMLWTTPESLNEHLPLVNQRGDLTITADARIDNREELLPRLRLLERPAGEISDSEVILAAYEQWGDLCVEKLIGDFAFAIWDARREILFCARDHFGIKPLYYYWSGTSLVFASEIKALLTLPFVPRTLNKIRIGDFLVSLFDDKAITFYQDILRLPPAHRLIISKDSVESQRYWSLNPSYELKLDGDEAYTQTFREIFTEAVRCRMRTAFPVGSMLSGGLDSSLITSVARKLLAQRGCQPLYTFSAVFDDVTESDERRYIDMVVAQGRIEPSYFHADQVSPLIDLERVLWHQDEPVDAGNLYINWCLYGAASQKGIRVVLDGFDGDTTVSHGTAYFVELARQHKWVTLVREGRAYARLQKRKSSWGFVWSYARRYGILPYIPSSLLHLRRQLKAVRQRGRPTSSGPQKATLLNPTFAQLIGLQQRRQRVEQVQGTPPRTEREYHHRLVTWGLMTGVLEMLDRTAAATNVEVRYPFWDKRLVEFCLALPPDQKLHRGWTRMIERRSMTGLLPRQIQWRPDKGNLGPSFEEGLRKFEMDRLIQLVLTDMSILDEYVTVSTVRALFERFQSRLADESDVSELRQILSLGLWLQHTGLGL